MKLTNKNIESIQKDWLLRCIESNKRRMNKEDLKALDIQDPSEIDIEQLRTLNVDQIAYIDLDIHNKMRYKKK